MLHLALVGKLIDDPKQETIRDQWLKVTAAVSVKTGEKKKAGEQYAPSRIIKVVAWGKTGERLMNHTKKGDVIWAAGKLQLDPVKDGKGQWVSLNTDDWGYAGGSTPAPAATNEDGGGWDADEIPF